MTIILPQKSIYFNDINIVPTIGKVKSRKDVIDEKFRIIVSPMLSLVGETFTKEAAKLGLSLTTPRYLPIKQKIKLINIFDQNKISNNQKCFLSIGLNESDDDLAGINCSNILFDIANGYIPQLKEKVERVYNKIGQFDNLMVGNVVTEDGVVNLVLNLQQFCKNLFIRVGIGNGKICKSSDSVGINRGNITELMECSEIKNLYPNKKNINLISDGGISKGGFCLKAWGAGADYVLMGSYFSNALEAETNLTGLGVHFGCASERQNKLAGLDRHSEGKEYKINEKELKPLKYLVDELWGGISSGISYVGCESVSEYIGNGVFEIKCNSLPPKSRI
jgi:hypothetical protein